MANSVYENFINNKHFKIKGLILPEANQIYFSNILEKKINKKIKILYSDKLNDIYKFIKKLEPHVVIVSTFNKILNNKIIKLSKFVNIHHGKLPKQKGRASINWAIIMGRKDIYITIHEVIPKLDSGKIILQKKIKISKHDDYLKIKNKISLFLNQKISLIIKKYINNKFTLKNNNSSKETWNCSRNPEDSMINFFDKRKDVYNLIRSSDNQNFGAFCFLKEKKITILEANIKSKKKFEGIIPGRVVKLNSDGTIDCLCADGVLTITKISYKKKIMRPKEIIKSTRYTLLND
jgi:methionyl-tRNA formyltransferase